MLHCLCTLWFDFLFFHVLHSNIVLKILKTHTVLYVFLQGTRQSGKNIVPKHHFVTHFKTCMSIIKIICHHGTGLFLPRCVCVCMCVCVSTCMSLCTYFVNANAKWSYRNLNAESGLSRSAEPIDEWMYWRRVTRLSEGAHDVSQASYILITHPFHHTVFIGMLWITQHRKRYRTFRTILRYRGFR